MPSRACRSSRTSAERRGRTLALAAGLAVACVLGARGAPAATRTILGESFRVTDPAGRDPRQRRVVVVGREPGSADVVVGDPSTDGATVEIVANGARPSSQTFALPAGLARGDDPGWRRFAAPAAGFRYTDRRGTNGPVTDALVKQAPDRTFTVRVRIVGVRGLGPQPHVIVRPPRPGTDGGLVLTIGGGDTYCVAFGGAAGGAVVNDGGRVFAGRRTPRRPTAEDGCPLPATVTTTSTTTTTTGATGVRFAADVQPILSRHCGVSGCHAPPNTAQGMDLRAGLARANLVGVASLECPTFARIAPGAPEASYLLFKLAGTGPCFTGERMPAFSPPLPAEMIQTIRDWVAAGALDD